MGACRARIGARRNVATTGELPDRRRDPRTDWHRLWRAESGLVTDFDGFTRVESTTAYRNRLSFRSGIRRDGTVRRGGEPPDDVGGVRREPHCSIRSGCDPSDVGEEVVCVSGKGRTRC